MPQKISHRNYVALRKITTNAMQHCDNAYVHTCKALNPQGKWPVHNRYIILRHSEIQVGQRDGQAVANTLEALGAI